MNNLIKKIGVTLVILAVGLNTNFGQTNVSGGIYSNTTWTKANSPYIVGANIVVFPGIILTIQPGVIIKFDSLTSLEIRQAQLIALGTATDSITFTSNSNFPTKGFYSGIYLNAGSLMTQFNYCNFKHASSAIRTSSNYTLTVKNSQINSNISGLSSPYLNIDSCIFSNNNYTGLTGDGTVTNCFFKNNKTGYFENGGTTLIQNCLAENNELGMYIASTGTMLNCVFRYNLTGFAFGGNTIDNCIISQNQIGTNIHSGVSLKNSSVDSNTVAGIKLYGNNNNMGFHVSDCQIRFNKVGILDSLGGGSVITKNNFENNDIGIILDSYKDTFSCNSICNNKTYGLKYILSNNISGLANNYWCTSDSASTEALIYDGYKNVNFGLVSFMPINTGSCNFTTGISTIKNDNPLLTLYPNPVSSHFTLNFLDNSKKSEIWICNLLGEKISSTLVGDNQSSTTIDVSNLSNGVYFVELFSGNEISRVKFIKQ